MSWFSELTSKAEAMLVKLDQETAQALQNPAQILPKSIVFDNNIRANETPDQVHQNSRDIQTNNDLASDDDGLLSDAENEAQDNTVPDNTGFESIDGTVNSELISNSQDYVHNVIQQDMMRPSDASRKDSPEQEMKYDQTLKPVPFTTDTPSQSRKFKLQTSKLRPTLHNEEAKMVRTNGYRQPLDRESPVISLGADDIRASINRSLQEYSQSSSQVHWREELQEPTTYSSHFDNRPNVVTAEDNDQSGKLHSSPSFSIDVPDDSDQSTNITSQILSQSALRNKSPFNLHKVINKLASQRGHSQSLLGDKTKIRLRRAQMRAASYLRRMNYYFQTYPNTKYWMIGYLVVLQILVVYVLFFYQSSGSSSYLINQVKQQQQELAEPSQHPNSERIHPYSDEQQQANSR